MKRLVFLTILMVISGFSFAQKKAVTGKAQPKSQDNANGAALREAYMNADYAKAVAIADRMLAMHPADQRTAVIKAMAYGMMGNKEMVRKTADKMFPRSPDTEGNFIAVLPLNLSKTVMRRDAPWYISEAHKLAPRSPVVYMIEASIAVDDSSYAGGIKAARAGLALVNEKVTPAVEAQLLNILHMAYYSTKDGDGMKDVYERMSRLETKSGHDSAVSTTHYQMLIRDKSYARALGQINALTARYPAERLLRKERAFLYEDMERHGDACAEAVKLSEDDDDYFPLLRKLGCPQAYALLSPAQVKSYIYDVDFGGKKYQFNVKPLSVKMAEGAQFDWSMTTDDAKKGSVQIAKAALDTAHAQVNTFSGGKLDLADATTVWVSNKVYQELKEGGKSSIKAGEAGPKLFTLVKDDEADEATITNASGRTRALHTLHAQSEDGTEQLWINDDPANPLITRMDLGWTIVLRQIE